MEVVRRPRDELVQVANLLNEALTTTAETGRLAAGGWHLRLGRRGGI
jgi:hypothetical protein